MPRRKTAPRRADSAQTTIRIVGGAWRGRRVSVPTGAGLRPSPDRVRETLFNWLAPRIEGARCLDLFAGTGALGLEALSRGAAHVRFVDSDRNAVAAIRAALDTFDAQARASVEQADALTLRHDAPMPDIVFIDPPFAQQLHGAALDTLGGALAPHARIYLEYPATQAPAIEALLAPRARLLRAKRAGRVGYCLAQPGPKGEDTRP